MFGKKKKDLVLMHYEGLQGFKQDFPCNVKLDDEAVVFTNNNGGSAKLPLTQIQSLDSLPEVNFMGKHHNNPVSTAKMGVKWFYIINYTSSSGESKYIALWGTNSEARKFYDELNVQVSSGEVTL